MNNGVLFIENGAVVDEFLLHDPGITPSCQCFFWVNSRPTIKNTFSAGVQRRLKNQYIGFTVDETFFEYRCARNLSISTLQKRVEMDVPW